MNSLNRCEVVPEEDGPSQEAQCFRRANVDGYHLATLRASRKDSVVISVKLFELIDAESVEVGRLLFHGKGKLPEDRVDTPGDSPIIIFNARLKDFERMMELIRGECRVGIEFSGEDWAKGQAYLKSLCYVFPERSG
ncbi:MAG: hypothetical protein GY838_16435 [bacterium]|nr:hypothetical protein [bacterium]